MLNPGQQFITLVPTDAPLEVEANIAGSDDGHVSVGDPVDIKFDTFQYSRYGLAHGIVRVVSPDSFDAQEEQRNPTGAAPAGERSPVAHLVVPLKDHPRSRSICTIRQPNFHLTPGMPVTADIRVGKQTVASLHARENDPPGQRRDAGALIHSRGPNAPDRVGGRESARSKLKP